MRGESKSLYAVSDDPKGVVPLEFIFTSWEQRITKLWVCFLIFGGYITQSGGVSRVAEQLPTSDSRLIFDVPPTPLMETKAGHTR